MEDSAARNLLSHQKVGPASNRRVPIGVSPGPTYQSFQHKFIALQLGLTLQTLLHECPLERLPPCGHNVLGEYL